MMDRLSQMEVQYDHLTALISDPAVIADQSAWQKHTKNHSVLQETVEVYRSYKDVLRQIQDNYSMLEEKLDSELESMIKTDLLDLREKETALEAQLKIMLLPKDPNDVKNVILEVRGGTGGDEASLFAADLLKLYGRYAEKNNFKTEVLSSSFTDIGGVKEVVLLIEGKGAYSRLKYESGVHRVQRIPVTESGGRIHTSAATVAVLPEAEEVDVVIGDNDIRIDLFCSSGPGGQSVNTTQSAVRLTHLPTGLVVSCQDEKSQHKNKDKAMKVLRARLMERAQEEQHGEVANVRRTMVGSGDRSERIRTYNFPQGRVTDHRVNLTSYKLEAVLQGDLDEFIDALINADQIEKLRSEEQ
ncbi:MAG: peptide chain release factor 1 [Peptococcaceae bacterium]|jgi:peptide chain release factor 1|nr:peptide chain release factor 1 [Peptococcaceae bacterium]